MSGPDAYAAPPPQRPARPGTPDATSEGVGWQADVTLTLLTLVATLSITVLLHGLGRLRLSLAVVTTLFMVLPLALRRRYPIAMLFLVAFGGLLHVAWSGAWYWSPLPCLAVIPLVVFSVARFVEARPSRWAVAIGVLASVVGPLSWAWGDRYWEFNTLVLAMLVCLGMVITPYVVGRRIREAELTRIATERAEAERHRIELAERERAARMAEVTVRQEIARELHDIVAHSLSVMVVQAEGGRALATKRPERAAEALATIAETGRDALDEMRRIVGVLRSGEQKGAAYAPAPGLADIPDMVARTGGRVRLMLRGDGAPPSQAVELVAYRVVQEAITNMLKHAGPGASADAVIDRRDDHLAIEVIDNGVGVPAAFDGRGNGLTGMAERVHAMGGALMTGPLPGGGFGVRATLPIRSTERIPS